MSHDGSVQASLFDVPSRPVVAVDLSRAILWVSLISTSPIGFGHEHLLEDSEGTAQRGRRQLATPAHKAITIDRPDLVKHDAPAPTAEAERNPNRSKWALADLAECLRRACAVLAPRRTSQNAVRLSWRQ